MTPHHGMLVNLNAERMREEFDWVKQSRQAARTHRARREEDGSSPPGGSRPWRGKAGGRGPAQAKRPPAAAAAAEPPRNAPQGAAKTIATVTPSLGPNPSPEKTAPMAAPETSLSLTYPAATEGEWKFIVVGNKGFDAVSHAHVRSSDELCACLLHRQGHCEQRRRRDDDGIGGQP